MDAALVPEPDPPPPPAKARPVALDPVAERQYRFFRPVTKEEPAPNCGNRNHRTGDENASMSGGGICQSEDSQKYVRNTLPHCKEQGFRQTKHACPFL